MVLLPILIGIIFDYTAKYINTHLSQALKIRSKIMALQPIFIR